MSRTTEEMIQEKALTAPRITPQDVENAVDEELYFTAQEGAYGRACLEADSETKVSDVVFRSHPTLGVLTLCVLVLKNGFVVTGESACASPENFDAEIGRAVARRDAINKVWPLLGFRLRDHLADDVSIH